MQAALDPLTSSDQIAAIATEKVFAWLQPARCNLIQFTSEGQIAELFYQNTRKRLPRSMGSHQVFDFVDEETLAEVRSDRPLSVRDIHEGMLSAEEAKRYAAFGTRAFLVVPYVTEGELRFALSVDDDQP